MATAESLRSRQPWLRQLEYDRSVRSSRRPSAAQDRSGGINVGRSERLASNLGGGLLLLAGLSRRGLAGWTLAGVGGALLYRGMTGHCSVYSALGANTALADSEHDATPYGVAAQAGVRVEEAITIDRPAQELYDYWRNHANLPRFMPYIASVEAPDGVHSHWVMRTPLGLEVRWEAEIHTDEPGRLLSWASTGGQMATAGSVRFEPAPGGRGTEVRLNQKYDPPGGKLGVGLAKLVGMSPERLSRETLRRLKQLMETGEVPTTEGQTSGRVASRS